MSVWDSKGGDATTVHGKSKPGFRETDPVESFVNPDSGDVHVLQPDWEVAQLGRSSTCDIRLEDEKVSRVHVTLTNGGIVKVVDNDSKNGVSVNGRGGKIHGLVTGDHLRVGDTRLLALSKLMRDQRPRLIDIVGAASLPGPDDLLSLIVAERLEPTHLLFLRVPPEDRARLIALVHEISLRRDRPLLHVGPSEAEVAQIPETVRRAMAAIVIPARPIKNSAVHKRMELLMTTIGARVIAFAESERSATTFFGNAAKLFTRVLARPGTSEADALPAKLDAELARQGASFRWADIAEGNQLVLLQKHTLVTRNIGEDVRRLIAFAEIDSKKHPDYRSVAERHKLDHSTFFQWTSRRELGVRLLRR